MSSFKVRISRATRRTLFFWLTFFASLVLGWNAAVAIEYSQSVDPVADSYQIGREIYLKNCSGCHAAIPPEVLPTDTWRKLLQNPQKHYGKKLPELISFDARLIWNYLKDFSRPLAQDEPVPMYAYQSRYFKALHPRVELPNPPTELSCQSCHPGAQKFDYRTLAPEWENSP